MNFNKYTFLHWEVKETCSNPYCDKRPTSVQTLGEVGFSVCDKHVIKSWVELMRSNGIRDDMVIMDILLERFSESDCLDALTSNANDIQFTKDHQ